MPIVREVQWLYAARRLYASLVASGVRGLWAVC